MTDQGDDFGFARLLNKTDCLEIRIGKTGLIYFKTVEIIFGNLVMRIDTENLFETFGGLLVFIAHRESDAEAIVGGNIIRDNFNNSAIDGDSLFPVFAN